MSQRKDKINPVVTCTLTAVFWKTIYTVRWHFYFCNTWKSLLSQTHFYRVRNNLWEECRLSDLDIPIFLDFFGNHIDKQYLIHNLKYDTLKIFQWIPIIMNEIICAIPEGEWIRNLSGITVNLVTTKDLWENNRMIHFLIV